MLFRTYKYADQMDFSSLPEEVCTLVITEAFPEDSGEFKCVAENEAGTAVSTAKLFVCPGDYKTSLQFSFELKAKSSLPIFTDD